MLLELPGTCASWPGKRVDMAKVVLYFNGAADPQYNAAKTQLTAAAIPFTEVNVQTQQDRFTPDTTKDSFNFDGTEMKAMLKEILVKVRSL